MHRTLIRFGHAALLCAVLATNASRAETEEIPPPPAPPSEAPQPVVNSLPSPPKALSEKGIEALGELERLSSNVDVELASADKDPKKGDPKLVGELQKVGGMLKTSLPGLRSVQAYLALHVKYLTEIQSLDKFIGDEKDAERKALLEKERQDLIGRDLSIPSPNTAYSTEDLKHDVDWLEKGEVYELLSRVRTAREDADYASLQQDEVQLASARAASPPSLLPGGLTDTGITLPDSEPVVTETYGESPRKPAAEKAPSSEH